MAHILSRHAVRETHVRQMPATENFGRTTSCRTFANPCCDTAIKVPRVWNKRPRPNQRILARPGGIENQLPWPQLAEHIYGHAVLRCVVRAVPGAEKRIDPRSRRRYSEDVSKNARTARSASKRRRRTPGELRRDIIAAAQEVFSEKGYAAASMREIAKRADAASPLIFRHFENKATLFATAVFEPIEKALDENLSKGDPYWAQLSPAERLRNYAELVIGTFRRHKRLCIAYLNALFFHADEFRNPSDGKLAPASFESRILQLERFSREHSPGEDFLLSDPHIEVRLILLLFYSVALFDDLFFDPSQRDTAREMQGVVKLVGMGLGLDPRNTIKATDGKSGAGNSDLQSLATENEKLRTLLIKAMLDLHKAHES